MPTPDEVTAALNCWLGFRAARGLAVSGISAATNAAMKLADDYPRLLAENETLRVALAVLLVAYEDGLHQCHCENSGENSPAPCTPCKARAALGVQP